MKSITQGYLQQLNLKKRYKYMQNKQTGTWILLSAHKYIQIITIYRNTCNIIVYSLMRIL